MRLRREVLLFCRLRLIPPSADGWPGRIGAGDEMLAIDAVDTGAALAVALRVLVLDDVR